MEEIDADIGVGMALDAILGDRLALLCGAGLSMASPSNLPSAIALAGKAKRKHDALYGSERTPLSINIEDQAEFFFKRGELGTVYLRALVDPDSFAGRPNAGHDALADLLLVRGIQTAVSTNVDTLIETAGMMLFGQIGTGLDGRSVAALPPDRAPLLKIHGCWQVDQANTVWAPGQLEAEPVASRIAASEQWLSVRLLDRDLIIIGYWTDWDYLNDVLDRTLGRVRPSRVIVVDPCETGTFAKKAPALYALGLRAASTFCHVRESGAVFLERLRLAFSQSFVRRVLYAGSEAYEQTTGAKPDPTWTEPALLDTDAFWRLRRDLEGRLPNEPARERAPPEEPLLGLTLLQLLGRGAISDGAYWQLDGRRIRVVRSPNQLLHFVEAAYAREMPPTVAPDITIAVGAEAQALPPHIVRGGTSGTIARGSNGRWLTRSDAITELGL